MRRAISGELALPGSPAYQDARVPFIAGLGEPRPQAVVRCHGPEDVAEVIAFAREHGIGIAIRSGGHSFAGYSSTSGIVIDLTTQRPVVLTGGVAKVGAGARLGELYDALLPDGLAIPASTCPSVGIGGLTLGGGHGILGRMYGLTLDHLTGARVVLESGQVVDCDEGDHAGARALEQQMHAAKAWVMASWATVRPCGSGRVYPNFPDPDPDDWGHAYYRANYARLVKIKAKYDPHGVFRFPQSLPAQQRPAGTTGTAGLHADAILADEDRGTASEGKK